MAKFSNNIINQAGDNNYLIGSNITNAFVIGSVGSDEDFFLVAAQPTQDSNYPLISGNFLDSEGDVLFKLVRNMLIVNPGKCSKILSDRIGYEIHDSEENLILKVKTSLESLPNQDTECWVTTIEGNFFDKSKTKVVEASENQGFVETSIGCAMGFNGNGFAMVAGMSDIQQEVAKIALLSQGEVFEPISGNHENEEIRLEGKIIMPDAVIKNCDILVENGRFVILGGKVSDCKFQITGEAQNIAGLLGVPLKDVEDVE